VVLDGAAKLVEVLGFVAGSDLIGGRTRDKSAQESELLGSHIAVQDVCGIGVGYQTEKSVLGA
jgi:hypothetical protein